MKAYNRIMAGQGSAYAKQCFDEGFIGIDYKIHVDLSTKLPDNWRDFNKEFRPVYLESHPGKSKIAAGLACAFTWTLCKGLKEGDIVITPDGNGRYRAGKISGPYHYAIGQILPHRRKVVWLPDPFDRSDMSEALRRSTNSTGTCCDITSYAEELDALIGGDTAPSLIATDRTVEEYEIYTVDGEMVGQQYPSDTGPIDILAISKDGKELLVVELKRGRASDAVVGQIQRYMGYVMDELAEENQSVKGVIIALEDDLRIRRALRVAQGIDFYRYEVSFKLHKQAL